MSESEGLGSLLTGQAPQTGTQGSEAAGSQPAEGTEKSGLEQRFSQLTGQIKDVKSENAQLREQLQKASLTNQGQADTGSANPIGWQDLDTSVVESLAYEGEGTQQVQANRELQRRNNDRIKKEAIEEYEKSRNQSEYDNVARKEIAARYSDQLSDQGSEFFRQADARFRELVEARGEAYAKDPQVILGICADVEAKQLPELRKTIAELQSRVEGMSAGERVSSGAIRVSQDEGVRSALDKGDIRGAIGNLPSVKGMR